MKKKIFILVLFSLACFFITDNVNASSDYFFTSMALEGGTVGSRNPGWADSQTNYATLGFGYYNINGTIPTGEKYRIEASYCVDSEPPGFDKMSYQINGTVDMTMTNFKYELLDNLCVYTHEDGNVYVGNILKFTIDFIVQSEDDSSATGFINIKFLKSDAAVYWWASFKDYTLYPSSAIIDTENTQNIINNQNNNTQNIIDNQNSNQQQTNDRLDNINDSITDETSPDVSNAFSGVELDTSNVVSDLVLLPINYLQRVLNLSSDICSSYVLDFGIFNSDYKLTLPCINLSEFFGESIWTTIDYLICFFMVYNIAMLCISAFEDITSLRDTYNGLYQPKHAYTGYKPKHGGD